MHIIDDYRRGAFEAEAVTDVPGLIGVQLVAIPGRTLPVIM